MSSNARLSPLPRRSRHDGWTAERQLTFLGALSVSRSVTRSAAAAGMSRESAYRLRERSDGALFAARWDQILRTGPTRLSPAPCLHYEGHDLGPLAVRRESRVPDQRRDLHRAIADAQGTSTVSTASAAIPG